MQHAANYAEATLAVLLQLADADIAAFVGSWELFVDLLLWHLIVLRNHGREDCIAYTPLASAIHSLTLIPPRSAFLAISTTRSGRSCLPCQRFAHLGPLQAGSPPSLPPLRCAAGCPGAETPESGMAGPSGLRRRMALGCWWLVPKGTT